MRWQILQRDAAWQTRVRLLLFGLVALIAVDVGFLAVDVNHAKVLVKRYGYYTISLTFVWALFALRRVWPVFRQEMAAITRRERWQIGGVIAACTAVALLTVPVTYKVLYDEMVLQATAWDLHFFREISTVLRGYPIDGVFMPLDTYLDKRPFFFVYVVSLLHDLTGYREANAFYLNMALAPLVLAQVYLLARRFAPHAAALAAVLGLGTLSLLAQNATGAGMELLNLVMLLGTMQIALWYLDAPDEPRLSALILAAVLLAQTRYESSLYVGPVALVALEGWRRAGRIILPPAAILGPALLIPYAVHNTYLSGTPILWELHENEKTRFGLQHLGPNLHHAWNFFFCVNPRTWLTNSLWLSFAGPVAVLFALAALWRARRNWRVAPPEVVIVVVFGAAILGNLLLLMFYYWGQLDDPIVARLSLPTYALLTIVLAYGLAKLSAVKRPKLPWIAAGAAVLAYFWSGLTANAQHTYLNTLDGELLWERRFVAQQPPGDRLILTNKSALPWMLCRIPAIAIEQARHREEALRYQLEHHTYRDIFVFQKYRPTDADGDYQMDPADRLPDNYVIETVTERRFGTRLDRVSRLVEIRPRAPRPEPTK
jgi:hypothetical protein